MNFIMQRFDYKPPLPTIAPRAELGFAQQIQLLDGKSILATASWHAPGSDQGVVQLLDLVVDPAQRRKGVGGALLRESIGQARAYHALKGIRFRRMWISVEQKSQVIARAFLTQHGFHHVATIAELLRKQDALIYVKSFD